MSDSTSRDVRIRREKIGQKRKRTRSAASEPVQESPRRASRQGDTPASVAQPAQENASPHATKIKVAACLFGVFCFLVLLALVSYTPFDEASASVSFSDFLGLLTANESVRAISDVTHNWLGLLGAVISHFLFNNTVGYIALLFPIVGLFWAYKLFTNVVTRIMIRNTGYVVVSTIAMAAFIGTTQRVDWLFTLSPEWYGAIGQFLSEVISRLIGTVGSFLFFTASLVLIGIYGFEYDKARVTHYVQKAALLVTAAWQRVVRLVKEITRETTEAPERKQESGVRQEEQPVDDATLQHDDLEDLPPIEVVKRPVDEDEPATMLRQHASPVEPSIPAEVQSKQQPTPGPAARIVRKAPPPEPPVFKEEADDAIETSRPSVSAEGTQTGTTSTQQLEAQPEPEPAPQPLEEERSMAESELEDEPALTLTVQEREEEEKVQHRPDAANAELDEEIMYIPPTLQLLKPDEQTDVLSDDELERNATILQEKLRTFKIEITDVTVTPGPVVTQYEFIPAAGIKVSQIENLADDIALALKARGIRIIAPVPGKGTVAVEIPNNKPQLVRFSGILQSPKFQDNKLHLPIALGKTINGEVFVDDLAKMPHLLIAGSTGSGKSVGINALVCSLLYKMHPRNMKMLIIDPKKVEMTPYRAISHHFLAVCPDIDENIVTEPANAVIALKSVEAEMDRRYTLLAHVGQRNIVDYNKKVKSGAYKDDDKFVHQELPFIVVVIDELADLMMTASKDVEPPITRLAQLARAIGIHLVVATQRPSVNVITGLIKANFPARMAYQVASKIDSRTILDTNGAEHLLGNGDMLYLPGGSPKPTRIQNSFLTTDEVEAVCDHIGNQIGYSQPFTLPSIEEKSSGGAGSMAAAERDEYFEEAARLVVEHQQGSVSLVQRRLKVGYSRAARIIDQLEDAGVVGPFDGSKARVVYPESVMELEGLI